MQTSDDGKEDIVGQECGPPAGQAGPETAQVIWATADVAGLAVPPSKAVDKRVQLSAPPEERGKAAAAVLRSPYGRRSLCEVLQLSSTPGTAWGAPQYH